MKVVVGAPVAARDWALKRWFECLYSQTRVPDEFVFVVKDVDGDRSRQLLHELGPKPPALSYAIDTTRYVPRMERNSVGAEYVYADFAWRRNRLLQMVRKREPDVFLSLDTDIMLEDPTTIERLLELLERAPVAAPLTYLHPAAAASECFNAGWWAGGEPGSPTRAWRRATVDEAHGTIPVDIPMAAVAMHRRVVDTCKYAYHECGEDMGFAQDLDRLGYTCLWDTDLGVRHVMAAEELGAT
jgi:hypothetical protein